MKTSRSDVKVPEGMLKAAVDATCDSRGNHYESVVRPALEAALQWLSDEIDKLEKKDPYADNYARIESINDYDRRSGFNLGLEAIRRMFLAEPEIPDPIEDLLFSNPSNGGSALIKKADEHIREAFRRGQRSKGSVSLPEPEKNSIFYREPGQ